MRILTSPDNKRTGFRTAMWNLTRVMTPGVVATIAIEHGHHIYLMFHTASVVGGHK